MTPLFEREPLKPRSTQEKVSEWLAKNWKILVYIVIHFVNH
jgi:hypothetical protein